MNIHDSAKLMKKGYIVRHNEELFKICPEENELMISSKLTKNEWVNFFKFYSIDLETLLSNEFELEN